MGALNNKQSANLRDEIIHWINGLFFHSHRHLLSTYSVPGSERGFEWCRPTLEGLPVWWVQLCLVELREARGMPHTSLQEQRNRWVVQLQVWNLQKQSGFSSLHFPTCHLPSPVYSRTFIQKKSVFTLQGKTLIQPPAWMYWLTEAPQATSHLHFHPCLCQLYFFKNNFSMKHCFSEQSLAFYSF